MNTHPPPSLADAAESTQQRLVHSREQIGRWLEQDAQAAADATVLGRALRGALPLLNGLRAHTGAGVVLGALAQAWLRSAAPAAPMPPGNTAVLDVAVALAIRHPKTTLATVGIAGLGLLWWRRSCARSPRP
jgi:uncharacterized protein YgbK (DUF1537 family)